MDHEGQGMSESREHQDNRIVDVSVKDPVCGMVVDEETAIKRVIGGKTFYFCGPGCKAAFDRDPHKYAHRA
jgi:YHS domain-containing protein